MLGTDTKPLKASNVSRGITGNLYGVNSHGDYTQTAAQKLASMKMMGMSTIRETYEGTAQFINSMTALASLFQSDGTGKKLYACIDIGLTSDGTNLWTSEQAAYNAAFANGVTVATALAPYASSVLAFECGNELGRKNGMTGQFPAIQGTNPSDFVNSQWPILRGAVRGCRDGVKSILPKALCASNALTFSEFALMDMLWNGTAPDGSSGWPTAQFDLIAVHSYHTWGDPLNEPFDGSGWLPFFNYWDRLNVYGVPLVISEWNADADSQSQADILTWVNLMLDKIYRNRNNLNIVSMMFYAMYSDPWNMLNDADGTPNAVGTAIKNFITANPDI